jgi:hypothetical protein
MKEISHNRIGFLLSIRPRLSIIGLAGVRFAIVAPGVLCAAQTLVELHKDLSVLSAQPVVLSVEIRRGDVDILYNRDGQVSIAAVAQAAGDSKLDDTVLPANFAIEQSGNHVVIRQISNAIYLDEKTKVRFRIYVPYRTEVTSRVVEGKQTIRGILGPVEARTDRGDIKASYVSKTLHAEIGSGNLELQVIGEHVDAKTLTGNISGERLPQGISAETQDGDITLAVVGPSTATVKKGNGRVDVRGARGPLTVITDAGDLHVQAIPHDDWRLNSSSGTIHLDLPQAARFDLNASTDSGDLQVERDDMSGVGNGLRHITQQVNGGGKRVVLHTESGKIAIQ